MNLALQDDFKFYVPIDIEKSVKDGIPKMILRGEAGNGSLDSSGESLDLDSFDLSRMYYVNWEHGKEPDDVVGVITQKQLKKGRLFLETELFEDDKKARAVWNLANNLAKKGRKLGYSVEGKILQRNPINKNLISKAELYGVAICKVPVNATTYVDIVKSFLPEEISKMDTDDMAPLMPESIEKKPKKKKKEEQEEGLENEILTKSEVYLKIFNNFTKNSTLADRVYSLIKSIDMEITKETIEKAEKILGLVKSSEEMSAGEEDLQKGQAQMQVEGEENGGDIEELQKAMEDSYSDFMEKAKKYESMCKAKGVDPKLPGETVLQKGEKTYQIESDKIIGALGANFETLSKSIEIRTTALGNIIVSEREENAKRIENLSEELLKANTTIEKLQEFNDALNQRIGVVERQPIQKSVTTTSFKERFEENGAGSSKFSISRDKNSLIQFINDTYGSDLSKAENVSMLEAAAELEMTGSLTNKSANILKSKGIEVIA